MTVDSAREVTTSGTDDPPCAAAHAGGSGAVTHTGAAILRWHPRHADVVAVRVPETSGDTLERAVAELMLTDVAKRHGLQVRRQASHRRGGSVWWDVTAARPGGGQRVTLSRGDWLVIDRPDSASPQPRGLTAQEFADQFDPVPGDTSGQQAEMEAVRNWARRYFASGTISQHWLDTGFRTHLEVEPLWGHQAAQDEVEHVRATLVATGARWYEPITAHDAARWARLRAEIPVAARVEPQLFDPAEPPGRTAPRHIVPSADFRGPRRRHQAGRALCETARRTQPLPLGGPSTGAPTCEKCLTQLQPRPGSPAPDDAAEASPAVTGNGARAASGSIWTTGADPVWDELNHRQKLYLEVFFEQDQEAERAHTGGDWMDRPKVPAGEWRQLTFDIAVGKNSTTGEGYSEIQHALRGRGVHDPGAGSTLAALTDRALIVVTHDQVQTNLGSIPRIRVRLTNLGRKVARAGLGVTRPATTPRGLLSEWGWKVLSRLCAAGDNGVPHGHDLPWAERLPSKVVENLLFRPDGRALVEEYTVQEPHSWTDPVTHQTRTLIHTRDRVRATRLGRLHHEVHHRCYAELYPEIDALDPDTPHPQAHADLAAHNARPPKGLLGAQDIALFLDLLAGADAADPWPRRALVADFTRQGVVIPQEVLDTPPGVWLRRARGPRGKSKSVDRLRAHRGGPLVDVVEVPVDVYGNRAELVVLTESGRRHAAQHHTTYRQLYPEAFARSSWRSDASCDETTDSGT